MLRGDHVPVPIAKYIGRNRLATIKGIGRRKASVVSKLGVSQFCATEVRVLDSEASAG
jgi:hypothetical protein